MNAQHHDAPFGPQTPWPIHALVGLALASLVLVALFRWQQGDAPLTVEAPAQWTRTLHFQDTATGDIEVIDAKVNAAVAHFSGEHGFLRGTLRALTRERALRGIGPAQPFELVGHVDGRLTLRDPATGQRIPLQSFGPTNAAVYAGLRDARPDAPLNR